MYKLTRITRKLLLLLLLAISVFSFSLPTEEVEAAGGSDCDTVAKVCRQGNEMLYNLCVAMTGDYANCALQEAQSNIDCITANGCPYNH